MKKKIFEIKPGQFDAFTKALKLLSFLKTIQIYDSDMSVKIATNAWLCVNFSGILKWELFNSSGKVIKSTKANFTFMNINHIWKELKSIPGGNAPIEVYEFDKKYVFTNGKAYVSVNQYAGFNKTHNIPDYKNKAVQMGTASILGKSDTKTIFKLTKKKGPIDLVVIKDELVAVGNGFGSRFPIAQNTVKEILNTEPTSTYRAFSFDKLDGKRVVLNLLKTPEDKDSMTGQPNIWLHAQIEIDTAIKFNYVERVIPISKHNWRN